MNDLLCVRSGDMYVCTSCKFMEKCPTFKHIKEQIKAHMERQDDEEECRRAGIHGEMFYDEDLGISIDIDQVSYLFTVSKEDYRRMDINSKRAMTCKECGGMWFFHAGFGCSKSRETDAF